MQPTPAAAGLLRQARTEASDRIGRELGDAEWAAAYQPAARKLARIIRDFGDENGARRLPVYLGELVQEQIAAMQLTTYCATSYAQKKTASEEDGLLNTISISPQTN